MSQLNPNITTAGATLAKTYRKTQGEKMKAKVANSDGRVPTLNMGGVKDKEGNSRVSARVGRKGRGAGSAVTDPEEARNDLISRHARGFYRDVAKRSNAIKGARGRKD